MNFQELKLQIQLYVVKNRQSVCWNYKHIKVMCKNDFKQFGLFLIQFGIGEFTNSKLSLQRSKKEEEWKNRGRKRIRGNVKHWTKKKTYLVWNNQNDVVLDITKVLKTKSWSCLCVYIICNIKWVEIFFKRIVS